MGEGGTIIRSRSTSGFTHSRTRIFYSQRSARAQFQPGEGAPEVEAVRSPAAPVSEAGYCCPHRHLRKTGQSHPSTSETLPLFQVFEQKISKIHKFDPQKNYLASYANGGEWNCQYLFFFCDSSLTRSLTWLGRGLWSLKPTNMPQVLLRYSSNEYRFSLL